MKNYIYSIAILLALFLFSCEEDNQYQFPVDDIPPGIVSEISVVNFKGYSEISYKTPTDKDLLYVECQYINSLGNERVVRASSFYNKLIVPGFLRSNVVPVKLVSVDKSGNRSNIVNAEIEPLDSPMFDILATVEIVPSFGGVKISWTNENQIDIVLEVLIRNPENGLFESYDNFYSSAPQLTKAVRGLEPVEYEFGVVIRDEFQQRTDTISAFTIPLYEEYINPENFVVLPHNKDFDTQSYNTGWARLWDGETIRGSDNDSYSIFGAGLGSVWFGFDLGQEVKLSRFKMWVRRDFYYKHSHPKHIQLWGTNDPEVANDGYSYDGWTMLGEWDDQKPSGNDASVANTEEDIVHVAAGIDFELPLEASSYRYIRFRTLETWGGTDRMWLAELKFWGQIK